MSTKAQTLLEISKNLPQIKVLPILIINTNDILLVDSTYEKIKNFFREDKLIIRSSVSIEDSMENSYAGHFDTVLNVSKNDKLAVIEALTQVASSYNGLTNEEILIQPMLKDIAYAGVVFTADMDTLADYYIINYDTGNKSDSITSGQGVNLKTKIIFKDYTYSGQDEKWITSLLQNCQLLEMFYQNNYLDIEFAVNIKKEVFIFQVRPLTNQLKITERAPDLKAVLFKVHKKIEKLARPHPNLLGDCTAFGLMPDWNPAEIIGVRPKKLALTLYKELITDQIWAHQRNNYGYRNLLGHPLMVTFAGIPYIDIRITFNSFIPKNLHENIAEKLANFYIHKLISKPNYHDKVEFAIVYSCYYLGISDKLQELKSHGFNSSEIKRIEFSLLELTNDIINPQTGLYKKDIEKVNLLKTKYDTIINSNISIIDKIYWLIENCKNWGTLPFAGVARAAFIAIQFLKSFIDLEIITKKDYDLFMNSLNTINKTMNTDLKKVFDKQLSEKDFLNLYGHIRPGTYDICSKRYDEDFQSYFSHYPQIDTAEKFDFSSYQLDQIDNLLVENGLRINAQQLLAFIKEAIEGREYTKYQFTKSLSQILILVEELALKYGLNRDDAANIDIAVIKNLYSTVEYINLSDLFMENIKHNKKMYELTKVIKLPSVILTADEVYSYYLLNEEPNFITLKTVVGEILSEEYINTSNLENKILFIKSADPGYDYIFSKNIGGLVCQFGGANSHMAIRCAELGIPAVIGIGEKEFCKWIVKKKIRIDCLSKNISSHEGD